jgi:hypothetical protein
MPTQETICSKEHFNQLLGCLFDAAWNPQEWPTFLENFGRIVGSVCTTLYYQDTESKKGSLSEILSSRWSMALQSDPLPVGRRHREVVHSC